MSHSIICVSRSAGAGGEEVAQLVAKQLGFRYVDDEIVRRAAELAGVSPEQVAQAEHAQPLVTRILEALATMPVMAQGGYVAALPAPTVAYSHLIEHVVRQTAEEKDVVIVAHGASHVLGGRREVLRVFVTASSMERAARLSRESGIDERAATKAVEDSDKERARYLDRFYKVRQELPVHYDLTVNTDLVTPATAAAMVVAAAKAVSPPST
jgi:cytidylate kinase